MKVSVLIIGGGIVGSSAAYFLSRAGGGTGVCVVERDPSYEKATTPQGAGGVRQQFSVEENIAQSVYSLDFYRNWKTNLGDIPDLPDIQFRQQGYLLVAEEGGAATLRENAARQQEMGARAELLDREALTQRFPSIGRAEITLGVHTPDDGWIDPTAALWGFRRAAIHLGATYVTGEVTAVTETAGGAFEVHLADGQTVTADVVINCAGPWVGEIAGMTGASLPVVPMCRVQHYWRCPHAFEDLPLVKDEAGMFFRPEGEGFVGGLPSFDIEPGFVDDIYQGFFADYFEETVWPLMADLVPKFEELRLERSWGGHYAQNLLDGNVIIGPYTAGRPNLLTACGFSGHGIMHAPAVGRALSELVIHGAYQTIDLSRFGYGRVVRNEPLREAGIK